MTQIPGGPHLSRDTERQQNLRWGSADAGVNSRDTMSTATLALRVSKLDGPKQDLASKVHSPTVQKAMLSPANSFRVDLCGHAGELHLCILCNDMKAASGQTCALETGGARPRGEESVQSGEGGACA